ncbi:hypothetical protein [Emcibacter sp. SYSU 3D8]|uniref:hypothetical protein n=1 Tax=Emcibacter sp. SYSU 3D8 TaxID=3133969 RepID=UPI0031FEBD1F
MVLWRMWDWVAVPARQARQHPLYGLNLILLCFYVLTLGGLLMRVATLSVAMTFSPLFNPADVQISAALLAAGMGLPLPFLVLSLVWRQAMPIASIACIWASVALDAGLLMLGIMPVMALTATIVSTSTAPLLTYYVLLSRRVNVTYRYRVRASDPALDAPVLN